MSWYYALGNERQGPVDDAAFERLITTGIVMPDTLVWKPGMADWQPLSVVRPQIGVPPTPVIPPPPAAYGTPGGGYAAPGSGFGTPGGGFGAPGWSQPASAAPETADQIYAYVIGTNRTLDLGQAIGRGWEVVGANFALAVGGTALWTVCFLLGLIPCFGLLPRALVNATLQAGVYRLMLKLHRGEPAEFSDAFSPFSTSYVQLLLFGLLWVVVVFICYLPQYVLSGPANLLARSGADGAFLLPQVSCLVTLPLLLYAAASWVFAPLLIVDKGLDFWPAMELSRKVSAKHFLPVVGLVVLCGLMMFAGTIALCLGLFVAAPFALASIAVAYDDLFRRP
jgi:hypothetical protein